MTTGSTIESPTELAPRYLRELQELVDDGELSPRAARRVVHDLFEPAEAGQKPVLREPVWRDYVERSRRRNG